MKIKGRGTSNISPKRQSFEKIGGPYCGEVVNINFGWIHVVRLRITGLTWLLNLPVALSDSESESVFSCLSFHLSSLCLSASPVPSLEFPLNTLRAVFH